MLRIEARAQGGGLLYISLRESIQMALKQNLGITVEAFNPRIREAER